MSGLTITATEAPTGPVLRLSGELDHATSAELRSLTADLPLRPGQRLVVDLSGLELCDSSGFTALVAALHHARTASADFALVGVPDRTLRVIRVVGLDHVFALYPDVDAATGVDRGPGG